MECGRAYRDEGTWMDGWMDGCAVRYEGTWMECGLMLREMKALGWMMDGCMGVL